VRERGTEKEGRRERGSERKWERDCRERDFDVFDLKSFTGIKLGKV
jgi:hypothetical protein